MSIIRTIIHGAVKSHPSRVRGLKYTTGLRRQMYNHVAPFTGAWIEMSASKISDTVASPSHPSRVRGLKLVVDCFREICFPVAPFTGAWIEMYDVKDSAGLVSSRTLHGCVD